LKKELGDVELFPLLGLSIDNAKKQAQQQESTKISETYEEQQYFVIDLHFVR
jgi:hypothetical protein